MTNNNTIYEARLHWILLFWPFLLFCFAIFLRLRFNAFHDFALWIAVFAILWGLAVWMTFHFSSLIIKKKQLIVCTGVLMRKTLDIPLNKIESIDIRQSILGSLLRYGSLIVTGTGGSRQVIHYLNKPLTCRRYIEQLMHQ